MLPLFSYSLTLLETVSRGRIGLDNGCPCSILPSLIMELSSLFGVYDDLWFDNDNDIKVGNVEVYAS